MKMLFFSSDETEVKQVGREFTEAGIPCEVRNSPMVQGACPTPEAELWIRDDRDCHRAFMLCVRLGLGFAKKPAPLELELDTVIGPISFPPDGKD